MKRLMVGIVVVGIVLAAGVASAQQSGPAMPEKVRAFLDKMTGSWSRIDEGAQGQAQLEWDAGKGALVDQGQFQEGNVTGSWSQLWSWDGESEAGIVSYYFGSASFGAAHGQMHGKLLSDKLLAGEKTVIVSGKEVTARFEIEFKDSSRVTWKETNRVVGGEQKPDTIETYTITKTGSDEQELIRLEQELARAFVDGDIQVIDRINADGMSLGTSEGTFITKEDVLAHVRSDKGDHASMVCEDLHAKVYGDMAVVTGKIRWTTMKGGGGQNLITDIFLKRDGRWQMVATHESEIQTTVDSAKLSPEMKKLEVWVGRWEYEGEQVDPPVAGLPYGGAGTFSGTIAYRFVLGGRFLEGKTEDHNPSGTTTSVELEGYDPKAANYVSSTFDSEGSMATSLATVSADGRTWTTRSTMTTSAGDKVPVRSVTTFAPDGMRYTGTTEVSTDGGQTWKHWYGVKGKKARD